MQDRQNKKVNFGLNQGKFLQLIPNLKQAKLNSIYVSHDSVKKVLIFKPNTMF